MKKLIVLMLVAGVMTLGFSTFTSAQDAEGEAAQTEEQAAPAQAPAQQQVVTSASEEDSVAPE